MGPLTGQKLPNQGISCLHRNMGNCILNMDEYFTVHDAKIKISRIQSTIASTRRQGSKKKKVRKVAKCTFNHCGHPHGEKGDNRTQDCALYLFSILTKTFKLVLGPAKRVNSMGTSQSKRTQFRRNVFICVVQYSRKEEKSKRKFRASRIYGCEILQPQSECSIFLSGDNS